MTITEAVTVDQATGPVGSYAGAVTAPRTPNSDQARDYQNLDPLLTAEELAQRDKVRGFVDARIRPNIAAVNGIALGGGCELAMSGDIRIATDTGLFGLPATNLSVLPAAGGTQRLARPVGTGRAIEMILSGRLVDSAEARQIGLVTSEVPGSKRPPAVRGR